MIKPSIPKGTRDFGPSEVQKRNYIFSVIRKTFEQYGYQPIETPAMENLQTLTGKYGEEGDKLLFKLLNNGDFLAKADQSAIDERNSAKLTPSISKRGLRYDLTVPFARYVTMHQHKINFPFKRYQIQPVWRADRPQKGRYQEFYQCDADVVGSGSLMYEAELIQMIDHVFALLGLQVKIRINNRKILEGIAEVTGCSDKIISLTTAVDKIQKIGGAQVAIELQRFGLSLKQTTTILDLIKLDKLDDLTDKLQSSTVGKKGIEELKVVFRYIEDDSFQNEVSFDPTLARGLDYYTGSIFEVQALNFEIGSILGGGRYDNLTGFFGLKDVSGVGISFGVARIFDAMEGLSLFPPSVLQPLQILLIAMDDESHLASFSLLRQLRIAGIRSDLYPEPAKMKKQMKYANSIQVPYVMVIGSQELASKSYTLKNMTTGEQNKYSIEEIIKLLDL